MWRWGALLLLVAGVAEASDLRLRADLVGAGAFPSIGLDRSRDGYLHLDLDVELPLYRALTVGMRGTPVFLYRPDGHPWIYALGFGLTSRVYLRGQLYAGPYLGLAVSTLRANRTFQGDSSRLNFLSQLSAGWQFPAQHWHVQLVFEHISNAYTTDQNVGVNGLGAAVGVDW